MQSVVQRDVTGRQAESLGCLHFKPNFQFSPPIFLHSHWSWKLSIALLCGEVGRGIKGKLYLRSLTSYLFNLHYLYLVGYVQSSAVVLNVYSLSLSINVWKAKVNKTLLGYVAFFYILYPTECTKAYPLHSHKYHESKFTDLIDSRGLMPIKHFCSILTTRQHEPIVQCKCFKITTWLIGLKWVCLYHQTKVLCHSDGGKLLILARCVTSPMLAHSSV